VRRSAAKAIGKLRIRQAVDQLAAGLKDREASMRIECLKALVALEAPQQEQAIKLALADREKSVRVAGLNLLENMAIPKSVMVELLTNVIATKTTEEKQAAIVTMGKIPLENSQAAFVSLLDQMK